MKKPTQGWLMGAKRKKMNSGQAILLIAMILVGLIAIIGVSIDGGRLLLLRRDAQNASDASVLAATFALCTGGTESQIQTAGLSAASFNGFTGGKDSTTVTVETNPEGIPTDACAECSVAVTIFREIDPFFIQIVYSGQLSVTTKAVGTCNPDDTPILEDTNGDGIPDAALPPIGAFWGGATEDMCNQPSVDLAGSDMIVAGNIHGNGDIKMNPNNQANGTCDTPPNPLNGAWTFGEITYSNSDGNFQDAKSKNCDWGDQDGEDADEPVCGASCLTPGENGDDGDKDPEQIDPYLNADGSINWPVDYDIVDYQPGGARAVAAGAQYHARLKSNNCKGQDIMNDAWLQSNGFMSGGVVQPGIYYSECPIQLNSLAGSSPNVTFVSAIEVQISGGGVNMTTYSDQDPLFFGNGGSCTANGVHISGNSNTWTGNIFAPNGNAQISNSSNTGIVGCIIGLTVKNSASGLDITCDPGDSADRGTIGTTQ